MAPIRLEDNFREKLEERELQPSESAWAKLEATLPAPDQPSSAHVAKNNNRTNKVMWYAIAASFIGILVVASFLLSQDNLDATDSEIVQEKEKPSEKVPSNRRFHNQDVVPFFDEPEAVEKIASEEIQKTKINTNITNPKEQLIVEPTNHVEKHVKEQVKNPNEGLAKVEQGSNNANNNATLISNEEIKQDQRFIENQVEKVVAKVQELENSNTAISAEEIDALLNEAQRELQTQRILNASKVDAAALLEDVENDLERSFRDKVFDALGDGYSIIRTAVVERNN